MFLCGMVERSSTLLGVNNSSALSKAKFLQDGNTQALRHAINIFCFHVKARVFAINTKPSMPNKNSLFTK